jgi:MSHA pilin protein MshD
VLNLTARTGADPMIRKQMLAIAEGLMDEVAAQPFTWCDPDDASAATATSAAVGAPPTFCTATVEAIGPEALETRGPLTPLFDNVNDYNGLAGITTSITGTPMPAGYTAAITVAPSALGPAANLVPAAASLLITVTVSFNTENLTIEGYRTRYVPNLLP